MDEGADTLRRIDRAAEILERLSQFERQRPVMTRDGAESRRLAMYEFAVARLLSAAIGRAATSACEALEGVALLLDELECLCAPEGASGRTEVS